MVSSINTSPPNPLISYQTTPVAPVSGPTTGTGDSDPAAQRQLDLEARIQDFENYLNGIVTSGQPSQSNTPSTAVTDNAASSDTGSIFTSYALTELEAQVQNFESYLNQSGFIAPDSLSSQGADASSSGDTLDAAQVLEAFVARQLLAGAATGRSDRTTGIQPSNSDSGSTPVLAKPIDLGAIVNAVERFLSKQGPSAISDPIQGQTTTPIPLYQTVQGRQDPLPVDGQEQTAKTSAQQSEKNRDTFTRELSQKLEDLAILNLEANKKGLEFDPVRDIESRSIYKALGETSPI
jgi:hypothetical protein